MTPSNPGHHSANFSRHSEDDGHESSDNRGSSSDIETSRSALREIVRNLQTEIAEKDQVIEEERSAIQGLKSDVQALKKTAVKRRKRAAAIPVNAPEKVLESVAKKFTVMNHFYITDVEDLLRTNVTDAWQEKERFNSQLNQFEGLVRELDALLPNDLQEKRFELADRWATIFAQAQQDERHSMTHRVRTGNQIQIFGKEIASQLEARLRPTSLLLQQQLGYDAESGKYQRVPPILRANPEEPASPSNMLNSEVVRKVRAVADSLTRLTLAAQTGYPGDAYGPGKSGKGHRSRHQPKREM
ncbi:hypothetical protein M407DRAFT_11708 [Tulasnella calospora MUT 4182]|uniref:Uncharacterized protein n=1 Tax=Tulasnella calospora MUT 4182 TaxID=1051891 RepID=A0A0C3Q686_9AGAM|nr:hypothetical protein M407DRAFT_11708 [Tulasnella calospora MUT 4182]